MSHNPSSDPKAGKGAELRADDPEPPKTVAKPQRSPKQLNVTMGFGPARLAVAAQPRDRLLLVRADSVHAGQVHAITGSSWGIGRHPDNQGCVDDESISRFHCRISVDQGRIQVEDLGSSNGTFINSQPLTGKTELRNGDTIQLGPRVCFRFSLAGENEQRMLEQLYESSVRDSLTGLHNRSYFSTRLGEEFAYATRHGTPLSVLMLDIDFFKKVNDTWGHRAGDTVLKNVSLTLLQQLRTEDLLARYGGEEFVILLRGVDVGGAAQAGERLRLSVERTPTEFEGQVIPTTISLGAASLACCSESSVTALLEAADRRLYHAKGSGRNRVVGDG